MEESCMPPAKGSILAVIVLYECAASESQSLRSLLAILEANPELASRFSLVVYDNSPESHPPGVEMQSTLLYIHDPSNPGLAVAYNFGLARAEQNRCAWLLLLDQDTTVNEKFIRELVQCTDKFHDDKTIASIVPVLMSHGKVCSPTRHFIDQLRHQYKRTNHSLPRGATGIQRKRYSAYNSGATIRVSALRVVGGFPSNYWLDYLDHAVSDALTLHGFTMYVMHAELEHEPSQASIGAVSSGRLRNLISAQTLFVTTKGNSFDRWLYRLWLLRYARILWLRHPDKAIWKEVATHALKFNARSQESMSRRHARSSS